MANNSPRSGSPDAWGVLNQEEQALQHAVQLSLEDDQVQDTLERPRFQRSPGQDYHLVLSLNNQFAPLEDPLGDTAIYIEPPPVMPGQNAKEYRQIHAHFDRLHIVQSANLRLMGENSKFKTMLGPMSLRAEKIIRKTGVLVMPEATRGSKFKYYINLSPATEGDEAIILVTDLSCTRGVLTWHLAMQKYDISPLAVLGHDDFITVPPSLDSKDNSAGKEADILIEKRPSASSGNAGKPTTESNTLKPIKNGPIGAEYSPLRHRSAIERVLQAIQGNDPKLDSAPKVWTYFAVAKYFGCAQHERVSGWITTWLFTQNNTNFIQCNPEIAYRIGMGIESAELLRDAFSILVGERALIDAYGEYNSKILNPLKASVHGRKLDLLDEDERNRIDHAASSLVSRIRRMVCWLCRDMDWLRDSPDYVKLENLCGNTEEETQTISRALEEVREYIRSRIYYVLCQSQNKHQLEPDTSETSSFRAGASEKYTAIYNSLNQPMRMFTKTFWYALQRTQFDGSPYNTSPEGTIGDRSSTRYFEALKALYHEDPLNGIRTISRDSLNKKFAAVNAILYQRAAHIGQDNQNTGTMISFSNGSSPPIPSNSLLKQSATIVPQSTVAQHVNQLNPESINLSSLVISGHSKHGSEDAGPSTQGPFSPSKRRKTSVGGESSQTSWRNSTGDDFFDAVSLTESTDPLLDGATSNAEAAQESVLALPIRQRHSSVVDLTQDGLKPQHETCNAGNPDSTVSKNETPKGTAKPRTGITSSADFGFQFPNVADKLPAPVFEPEVDHPKARTSDASPKSSADEVTSRMGARQAHISAWRVLDAATSSIRKLCSSILDPPHLFHTTEVTPTNLFDTLTCLEDDEFKYLPLWAGGNDDGTGGVYEDFPVPNLDAASQSVESFRPGRIHKPYNAPSVSDAGTTSNDGAFDYVPSSEALSTIGKASKRATDGTHTVVSLGSAASEAAVSDAGSVVFVPTAATDEADMDAETRTVMGESDMNGDAASDNKIADDLAMDDDQGNDSDSDTDMEVEVQDRSDDDGEDFDDAVCGHDFDDDEFFNDDDDFLARHDNNTGVNLGVPEDSNGSSKGNGKGKGKERAIEPVKDDDDDFELL